MVISRDSAIWWAGMLTAVLTALASQAGVFPPEWTPYINLGAIVVGIVSGKLATSPLPGAKDDSKIDMSGRLPLVVLALTLSLAGSACGPKQIHTAALISDQFGQSLVTAQSAVTTAYQLHMMDQATYRSVQAKFEKVAMIGLAINAALRQGNEAGAVVQVAAALGVVDALIAEDIPKIKPEQRTTVLLVIAGIRMTLLTYAGALGAPEETTWPQ